MKNFFRLYGLRVAGAPPDLPVKPLCGYVHGRGWMRPLLRAPVSVCVSAKRIDREVRGGVGDPSVRNKYFLLTEIFEKGISKTGDFERVLEILYRTKSLKFTLSQAASWSESAVFSLKALPDSEMRGLLIDLASEIVYRNT